MRAAPARAAALSDDVGRLRREKRHRAAPLRARFFGRKSWRPPYGPLKHIAIAPHVPRESGSAELKRRDRFGLEFAVRGASDCSEAAHFRLRLQPSNVEAIRTLGTPSYIHPV